MNRIDGYKYLAILLLACVGAMACTNTKPACPECDGVCMEKVELGNGVTLYYHQRPSDEDLQRFRQAAKEAVADYDAR